MLAVHYGPAHFAKPEPDELETHALLAAHPEVAAAVSRTIAACLDANGQRATFWDEEHVVELLPPLAVFWGELDAVVPFVHCTEAMERLVGAQMHVYPSSGHFPHLDEPERFARELADFLVTADVPRCRVLPPPCRDAIVESPILTQPGEAQPPLLSAAPSSGPISIASITEWLGGWIWREPITSEKEITSGKECAARG